MLMVETTDNGVVVITLNDPSSLNAMGGEMMSELNEELTRIEDDRDARVVVLTGAGRGFSSGANMKALVRDGVETVAGPRENEHYRAMIDPTESRVPNAMTRLRTMDTPSIAAVNGFAVGGGMGLALCCDIRIASEEARFAFTFTKRGLSPFEGSTFLLPRAIGLSRALEMAYTGDMVDGKKAERIGLVSEVVPHDQLMETTMELANRIALSPPIAVALDKYMMTRFMTMDFDEAMIWQRTAFNATAQTEDHKEGLRAFAEKRTPQFKGT